MKHEELTKNETWRINKNVFSRQSSIKTASQTVEDYQMPWGVSGSITSTVFLDLWGMSWMGCWSAAACSQLLCSKKTLLPPAASHEENTLWAHEKNGIFIVWLASIQPFECRWLSGSQINSGSLLLALHQNISSICMQFPDRVVRALRQRSNKDSELFW